MPPQGSMMLLQEGNSDLLKRLADAEAGGSSSGGGSGGGDRQREGQPLRQQPSRLQWPPPLRSESSDAVIVGRSSPPPTRLQRVSSYLSPGTTRCRRLLPALLLFLAVAVLLITGGVLVAVYHRKLLGISEWMRARAPASAVYFAFFTALWVTLCLPCTPIELVAGFVFGFPVAFAALVVGKPLGCCLAFGIGRCVAADSLRDGLLKRAHGEGPDASRRARALFLAMERHPWKMTLLLRLMYLPIAFKNYGLSLLPGCPFPIFALCTLAASVPYTLLWAHMGASSRSLLDLLSGHHGKGGLLWEIGVVAGGLLFAILLALLLRHYTLKYMRRLAEEEEDISEREQQEEEAAALLAGVAAAAAAGTSAAVGALEEGKEALLRRPLRAGPPPPTYGVEAAAASSGSSESRSNSKSTIFDLPFLKWQKNGEQSQQQGIGLSPIPSPSVSGGGWLPQPPRLQAVGSNGQGREEEGGVLAVSV